MLRLENQTPWSAGLYPGWGQNRRRQVTVVIKAGFLFNPAGELNACDISPPLEETDRHFGPPATTSLAAAQETVPFKKGAELLLTGEACPPSPHTTAMEVSIALEQQSPSFNWSKTLRVYGPRRWKRTLLGLVPSEPEMLQPLPLRYEYAYGGPDKQKPDYTYAPNPAGTGFSYRGWKMNGQPLPQIERPDFPLTSPGRHVPVAGFGPLPRFWEPRIKAHGSIHAAEADNEDCPYPEDALDELHNCAPIDQRFSAPFRGGEKLTLKGLVPPVSREGVSLSLPKVQPELILLEDAQPHKLLPECDTLLIDTSKQIISLIWRLGLPWDPHEKQNRWLVLRAPDHPQQPERTSQEEVS